MCSNRHGRRSSRASSGSRTDPAAAREAADDRAQGRGGVEADPDVGGACSERGSQPVGLERESDATA